MKDFTLDPAEFPHLRIDRLGFAGSWRVRLPWSPFRASDAERERWLIVKKLTDAAPVRKVCAVDSDSDSIRCTNVDSEDQIVSLLDSNHDGWVILFYDTASTENVTIDISYNGIDKARQQLNRSSAEAVVFSLIDDAEWIVVTK